MTGYTVSVPAADGSKLTGTLTVSDTTHTSPYPTVPYEAFAAPGDELQVSLQSKFNAYLSAHPELGGKARIKMQPGLYPFRDFSTSGYGIINDNIAGFEFDPVKPTIFQQIPHSSTKASQVPTAANTTNPLCLLRFGKNIPVLITGRFILAGTDQGHLYNGLSCYMWAAGSYVESLLVTGIPGGGNAPPDETFAIDWYRCTNNTFDDPETDGYQYTWTQAADGTLTYTKSSAPVGGSPFGGNGSTGLVLNRPNFHDSYVSMPTWDLCSGVVTNDLLSLHNGNTSAAGKYGSVGINHEHDSGTFVHNRPRLFMQGPGAQHVFLGADNSRATVRLNAPQWSGGDSRAKGALVVCVPNSYGNGQKQTPSDFTACAPDGTQMTAFDAGINWATPVPSNIDTARTYVLVR
jgi:hypothetical protein